MIMLNFTERIEYARSEEIYVRFLTFRNIIVCECIVVTLNIILTLQYL